LKVPKVLPDFHPMFDRPMIPLEDVIQVLDQSLSAMPTQDSFLVVPVPEWIRSRRLVDD
jgi:hypothetical protein